MDLVRTRTGGRSTQVRDRVFGAMKAALESGDLEALSVDRIAESAGVHRSTIYRRWLSSAGLMADLLTSLTPLRPALPDTGDLSRDLQAVARRVVNTVSSPWVNTTLRLTAASSDTDLHAAASTYWSHILDHTATIVRRAQTRGQATTDIDAIDAIESLLGPIYLRLLVTRSPITKPDIANLAERTARMLRP